MNHSASSSKPQRGLPGTVPSNLAERRRYARVGGCFLGALLVLFVAAYAVNQARVTTTQQVRAAQIEKLEAQRDALKRQVEALRHDTDPLAAPYGDEGYALAVHVQSTPRHVLWIEALRELEVTLAVQGAPSPSEATSRFDIVSRPLAARERFAVVLAPEAGRVQWAHHTRTGGWHSEWVALPQTEAGEPPMVALEPPEDSPSWMVAGRDVPLELRLPLSANAEEPPSGVATLQVSAKKAGDGPHEEGAPGARGVLYPFATE